MEYRFSQTSGHFISDPMVTNADNQDIIALAKIWAFKAYRHPGSSQGKTDQSQPHTNQDGREPSYKSSTPCSARISLKRTGGCVVKLVVYFREACRNVCTLTTELRQGPGVNLTPVATPNPGTLSSSTTRRLRAERRVSESI